MERCLPRDPKLDVEDELDSAGSDPVGVAVPEDDDEPLEEVVDEPPALLPAAEMMNCAPSDISEPVVYELKTCQRDEVSTTPFTHRCAAVMSKPWVSQTPSPAAFKVSVEHRYV